MRNGHPAVTEAGPGRRKEGQLRGSGSGYLTNSGTRSPSLPKGQQSLVIPCTLCLWSSLHCVRSLWSSPALCPQSLVIPCTVSAV
ncbi:unnamed protein product, partial [Staurois parvus]